MMNIRRRTLMKNVKGEDEDMGYELDAPKLIVDYIVEESLTKYEFKVSDYPELAKCKVINITEDLTNANVSGYTVYLFIRFDDKSVAYVAGTNQKYLGVTIQEHNGLWNVVESQKANTNAGYGSPLIPISLIELAKYTPIKNSIVIIGNGGNKPINIGTRIRIYGFY